MRVTIFTSNQRRHLSLVQRVAQFAERVYAVHECVPLSSPPFLGGDNASAEQDILGTYFSRMRQAELETFGDVSKPIPNVSYLPLVMGDLSKAPLVSLREALASDAIIVFGASFIKGALCQKLEEKRAINIHMGVSPFYRGAATNFWALHDGRYDCIGATIHLLTSGLDSGPILFHSLPGEQAVDGFRIGMEAVKSAHSAVIEHLRQGGLGELSGVVQDRSLEKRYCRKTDFNAEAAKAFLNCDYSPALVLKGLQERTFAHLVRPRIA